MVKKQFKAKIKYNKYTGKGLYIMDLETPGGIVSKPGQFISILIPNKTLRRPISILENTGTSLRLLYKIRGEGTKYLSMLTEGESIDFTGPFGNSFSLQKRNLLIGAGVGIAPVYYLKGMGINGGVNKGETKLIAGFKTKDEIPEDLLPSIDFISTDDGSYGVKGSIVDYTKSCIDKFKPDNICICGPVIVMKLISQIALEKNINCQVSMESMMGCSIGACRGCVIKINDNGIIKNASVCKEGTVFDARKVFYGGCKHA